MISFAVCRLVCIFLSLSLSCSFALLSSSSSTRLHSLVFVLPISLNASTCMIIKFVFHFVLSHTCIYASLGKRDCSSLFFILDFLLCNKTMRVVELQHPLNFGHCRCVRIINILEYGIYILFSLSLRKFQSRTHSIQKQQQHSAIASHYSALHHTEYDRAQWT